MLYGIEFRLRERLHCALRAALAVLSAFALLAGPPSPGKAQAKLTSDQEQTLTQCLAGCKKNDANCQNSCTNKAATPAYFSAAGSCVRACADAMAGPGQQEQSRAGDLIQCVRACN